MKPGEVITAPGSLILNGGRDVTELTVTNTGDMAGDEVVQVYLRDVSSSVTRPVKELAGVQRVTLQPGETRQGEMASDGAYLQIEYEDDENHASYLTVAPDDVIPDDQSVETYLDVGDPAACLHRALPWPPPQRS